MVGLYATGLMVERRVYDGAEADDQSWWRINEDTGRSVGNVGWEYWQQVAQHQSDTAIDVPPVFDGGSAPDGALPAEEVAGERRTLIVKASVLPYSHVLEVDPFGDVYLPGPHLLCTFTGEDGPYTHELFWTSGDFAQGELDPARRRG